MAIRTAAALGPALEVLERDAVSSDPRSRALEVQARQLAGTSLFALLEKKHSGKKKFTEQLPCPFT